jgi:TetR/AcrR family transcriptional regulator
VGTERLVSDTPPPSREGRAEATKLRILDAGESEFAARGFHGARLANIARAAGVQQALIHHYFSDKEGLYRAIVERGVAAMTSDAWEILEAKAPARTKASKKRMTPDDVRALAAALVDLMVDFYATHGALVLILSRATDDDGPLARDIVATYLKPQFEVVCARVEEMRARGEIRADVVAEQLVVSTIAMASYPFLEERFLGIVWPIDVRAPSFVEARKREIIETVVARALP